MLSEVQNAPESIACEYLWFTISPQVHIYVSLWLESTLDQMGRPRVKIEGFIQRVSSDDGLARWHIELPNEFGSDLTSIDLVGGDYDLDSAMRWVEHFAPPGVQTLVAPATS